MKKIIVGNWKMNPGSLKEAQELFDTVKLKAESWKLKAEVVICPPFVYIFDLGFSNSDFIKLGAQNITDEFSVKVLEKAGVEYVILGHSDVRKLGETNEIIAKKMQAAQKAGLKVILCVGENGGEDRDSVLEKQLAGVSDVIVAYEPVWAIGTGKNCQPEDVKEAVTFIKKIVGDVKVIYGGSVNSQNAKAYLEIVDGLLPGGASLKPEEFTKIVKAAE